VAKEIEKKNYKALSVYLSHLFNCNPEDSAELSHLLTLTLLAATLSNLKCKKMQVNIYIKFRFLNF